MLDTGAEQSVIQPNILVLIKEEVKVEHVARAVKIKSLNQTAIPYLSAVNLKFKMKTSWFVYLRVMRVDMIRLF